MGLVNISNLEIKKTTTDTAGATSGAVSTSSTSISASSIALTFDLYSKEYDFSSVSDEEKEKRKTYSSCDWALELQKADNDLFDRTIMDSASFVKKNLIENDEWRVDIADDKNGDGEITDDELVSTSLLDAIVASYDSALDL